jgi:hypothetical protein
MSIKKDPHNYCMRSSYIISKLLQTELIQQDYRTEQPLVTAMIVLPGAADGVRNDIHYKSLSHNKIYTAVLTDDPTESCSD